MGLVACEMKQVCDGLEGSKADTLLCSGGSDQTSSSLLADEDSVHLEFKGHPATATPPCPSIECTISSLRQVCMQEAQCRPSPDYLYPGSSTSDEGHQVTPHMRMIVVSWLVEVTEEFHAASETLHLAVTLLDRFLGATQDVPGAVLQLVAVACFFVACKQLEVRQPTVEQLTEVAASCFTGPDLVRMTRLLLDALDFRVTCPTSALVLALVRQQLEVRGAGASPQLAAHLLELALLDHCLVGVRPTQLATAALLLAGLTAGEVQAVGPTLAACGLTLDPAAGLALLHRLHRLHVAARPPLAPPAAGAGGSGLAGCGPEAEQQGAVGCEEPPPASPGHAPEQSSAGLWELMAPVAARYMSAAAEGLLAPLEVLPPAEQLVGLWEL